MIGDPVEEGDALGFAFALIGFEEGVEDAGLGEAEMAVAEGERGHGLLQRALFMDQQIERGEEAGPVGAGLAMHQGRFVEALEESL